MKAGLPFCPPSGRPYTNSVSCRGRSPHPGFRQRKLTEAGFEVVQVGNADLAIAVLEARQDIHLVFTDIDMPGSMDGLKLAAVRDRWPPVHIIITTGKARPMSIPANALFIPKPYLERNVVTAMRTFDAASPIYGL